MKKFYAHEEIFVGNLTLERLPVLHSRAAAGAAHFFAGAPLSASAQ